MYSGPPFLARGELYTIKKSVFMNIVALLEDWQLVRCKSNTLITSLFAKILTTKSQGRVIIISTHFGIVMA